MSKKTYTGTRVMWKCRKFIGLPMKQCIENKPLLLEIITKLTNSRKITYQEGEHLKQMILSPDEENHIVALTIMKSKTKK